MEALGTEVYEEVDIIEDERVTKIDVEENLRITTQSKIQVTLKETSKGKEVEMISIDTKEVDNINDKKEVVIIDDLTQTIAENEDRMVTEKAISIDNKEEIRITAEGGSNKNNKSIAAK